MNSESRRSKRSGPGPVFLASDGSTSRRSASACCCTSSSLRSISDWNMPTILVEESHAMSDVRHVTVGWTYETLAVLSANLTTTDARTSHQRLCGGTGSPKMSFPPNRTRCGNAPARRRSESQRDVAPLGAMWREPGCCSAHWTVMSDAPRSNRDRSSILF
jgi:hypothetical protein